MREVKTRRLFVCRDCQGHNQFSARVGSIFEDSPIKLGNWLTAIWLLPKAKNGISSHELGRSIGVTQKTAWFMLHRIRTTVQTGTFQKLHGTVESDETFIGGAAKNMHKDVKARRGIGRGPWGKSIGWPAPRCPSACPGRVGAPAGAALCRGGFTCPRDGRRTRSVAVRPAPPPR